jgi:hypothetical protein
MTKIEDAIFEKTESLDVRRLLRCIEGSSPQRVRMLRRTGPLTHWFDAIACDNAVDDPLVVDSDSLGIDPDLLELGKRIERWSDLASVRATNPEDDGDPDDVLQNHLGLPIYSACLRAALEAAGIKGFQFLPVRVFRPNGKEIKGFSIANVTERRAALDRSRSDFDVFQNDYFIPERVGKIRGIRRPALNADALQGCDVVRLDEFPFGIYVSERFKDVFERHNFTGYSFNETL